MGSRLSKKAKETFESIKRIDENGQEWWNSRELAKVLGYSDYRYFREVGNKAAKACTNSGLDWSEHFVVYNEMIPIGKGAERQVDSVKMSRYACYLAVQNADPSKTIVAQAQTYFAIHAAVPQVAKDLQVAVGVSEIGHSERCECC